ncbi:MAG: ATP-binding cassette domain-containing protein [Ferruginibacter sp.]|nr:ATP-binding cassette domain-containing protein [Cytophagales bacterium]
MSSFVPLTPTLTLENVVPAPLAESVPAGSQVWDTRLALTPGRHYHVSAVSGKGKSTLVSILYGLRQDYRGSVRFDGRDIRAFTPGDWATHRQRCFSIVFQDLRLFLHHSGWENILVKTDLYGPPDRPAIRRLADRLDVGSLLDKPCGRLSYGERQRMALLRALVPPFGWLLLDEPFSHLDRDNAERAAGLIAEACASRNAGLVVTSLGEDSRFGASQPIRL